MLEDLLNQLKTWQDNTVKYMKFEIFWNGDEWGVGLIVYDDEGQMSRQHNNFGATLTEAVKKAIEYINKNGI